VVNRSTQEVFSVSTETQNRGVMPQDLIEVCMTGNVTRPVARREAGGTVFCTIPLASNYRPYRDPQGNTVQPPPLYIDVEVAGAQADACAKHLVVGQKVTVVGEIRTRSWTDPKYVSEASPEGRTYKTFVQARQVIFGQKPQSFWQNGGTAESEQPAIEPEQQPQAAAEPAPKAPRRKRATAASAS
jgi:single-stranded DNA-binding protein